MIRKPAVAGLFYEMDPKALRKQIEWCFKHQLGPGKLPDKIGNERNIKGAVVPHAGYPYSGPVVAHSYYSIAEDGFPETFVILCPNHTGMGSGVSAMTDGTWETPLGMIDIDNEFADKLVANTPIMDSDPSAHIQEHSAEVQLPFLQYLEKEYSTESFRFVPVCMWMQDIQTAMEIGSSIHETAKELGRDVLVVASSDMTHYQPQDIARRGDMQVLDAMEAMDENLLMTRVAELNITMCGYGPVTAAMTASKAMGAGECEVKAYATSGDTTGDHSSVVGYASAIFL
ncbi:AmmeMemoRadiSam system protein B [Methanobacterium aggregans]|uniref:AmmeMemoRadiSam system protein B n=1 Tax=Methanobacterium aggregans TaxID=1615586 RepID=UPI001AE627E3|nr:AmmeMemoRadiSam system protein B [Methanobacterium aggregans]MBP2044937.1 AmmeMemoRadiSam system protein B [Methanobacterium aggregans]